ncbi:hypothetical protein IAQ61_006437 [Plenodomus lingam]|uniref:uncharacterized protein n=1 Tax=Leptosphaeria maculans TaxID=5022 RepID=UPI003326CF9B|nr:hypothetical protein IAQ61_006437 [Plenodomus lingam]
MASSASSASTAASASNAIAIPRRKNKLHHHTSRHSMDSTLGNHFGYGRGYDSYGSLATSSTASTPQVQVHKLPVARLTDGQITCVKASQGFDWNQGITDPSPSRFCRGSLESRAPLTYDSSAQKSSYLVMQSTTLTISRHERIR